MTGIELFGFISTTVVLSAFLMKDVRHLRILSILGSSMFATYGFMLGLHPIMFTNIAIVLINIYNLSKKQ